MCLGERLLVASRRKLHANHPQLLFQFAQHLNQDVLGREIELSQSIRPVARALGGFSKATRDNSDRLLRPDGLRLNWRPRTAGGNRGCLAIWATSHGDYPFGDGVSQISPGGDEIVELFVQWPKELADDGPMQLLSDERQVNQLDQVLL